jgi:hypothetical protein
VRLRLPALLALLGLALLFGLKGAFSVWPAIFEPVAVARAAAVLQLVASLLMLLFFKALRDRLEARGRRAPAAAATIAMAGAGIGALVDLRSLLVSVDLASATREATAAGRLGEAAAAAALLWFFVALHRRARDWLRGTGFAVAGTSLLVALALAVFVLQASGTGLGWLGARSYLPAAALAPVALVALAGPLRFLALTALDPSPLSGS